jgi:hypothetical protein
VYGIVLVYHVDRFALVGEFDVNGTSTIIAYIRWITSIDSLVSDRFTVVLLLFLLMTFSGLVLHAVMAHILEPRTITTFFVLGRAFHVLEAIGILDSFNDRSASREH